MWILDAQWECVRGVLKSGVDVSWKEKPYKMSSAVPIGTFFLVACFIMQCVGVATEYWITASLSGLANSYAGLFKMCYEVLSQQQCVYYIKFSTHFQNGM